MLMMTFAHLTRMAFVGCGREEDMEFTFERGWRLESRKTGVLLCSSFFALFFFHLSFEFFRWVVVESLTLFP